MPSLQVCPLAQGSLPASADPHIQEGRKDTACSQGFDPIKRLGRHRAGPAASRATFARGVGEGPAPSDLAGHPTLLLPLELSLQPGAGLGDEQDLHILEELVLPARTAPPAPSPSPPAQLHPPWSRGCSVPATAPVPAGSSTAELERWLPTGI